MTNVNNGGIQTIQIGDESFSAGVVVRPDHIAISYSGPPHPRPVVGGCVILEDGAHRVLSVESSQYVRGFLVVKAETDVSEG
jgi:hypothetical protein